MKRKVLIAIIGYIIGILWGLYFKISIVPIYIILIAIYYLIKIYKKPKKQFKLFSIKRYSRYLKLIFNKKVICSIIIISIISNIVIQIKKNKYEKVYNDLENIECEAVIASDKKEKEYKNIYEVKIKKIQGKENLKDLKLYISENKKATLEYGDIIQIKGKYKKPEDHRNYGGFSYEDYLKTKGIYGTIEVENIVIKQKSKKNLLQEIKEKIINNSKEILSSKTSSIFLGLVLGNTDFIDENTQEDFQISNMSHILAVSGMHMGYLVLISIFIFEKILGKRRSKYMTIVFIMLYMALTGFTPSVVRAGLMAILIITSKIIYRKSDVWSNISLALLISLIYNPYLILNIGLQLSYAATLGILIFNKNLYMLFKKVKIKNKKIKYRINKKILNIIDKTKQIIALTVSAQIFVIPLSIYYFNLLGIYFILSNLVISIIIAPIFIISIIFAITLFINIKIAKIISIFLEFGIMMLVKTSEFFSILPLSNIKIKTPKIYEIIFFYILILLINYICKIKNLKNLTNTQTRMNNVINLFRFKIKQIHRKNRKIAIIPIIIFFIIIIVKLIPGPLKINFIDVGQGDSTFIVTPKNKTILIDGGGSENFDVGKNTLIPYILDRGYTKIDYIIISHFDQDHIGGILNVLEQLDVEKVIIAKQYKTSENYEKFKNIVNDKKISIQIVEKGDCIKIEKEIEFEILWPDNEPIEENYLNNNAIVAKLKYNDFSCLFTGDIEAIAEKKILKEESNKLNSNILKVAHHGSKTSTLLEFLQKVKPKIALIGVGKNNLFGHPSEKTIENLNNLNVKIYRTDENGEISIKVFNNRKN